MHNFNAHGVDFQISSDKWEITEKGDQKFVAFKMVEEKVLDMPLEQVMTSFKQICDEVISEFDAPGTLELSVLD